MKQCKDLGSNRATLVWQWAEVAPGNLKPAKRRTRSHPKSKMRALRGSIAANGIVAPIVVNAEGEIVDGHLRAEIAIELRLPTVPIIRVDHMSEADLKALAIAANRMPADVTWDMDAHRLEFEAILQAETNFDLTLSGFSIAEVDRINGNHMAGLYDDLEDDASPVPSSAEPIAKLGDVWALGEHRIVCGDATDPYVVGGLMGGCQARAAFLDPPYNVKINGHVSGSGTHSEFAMASGEMSIEQFDEFLDHALDNVAAALVDGGICFACMDHAHLDQLLQAGDRTFESRLNICVWDKGQGGDGLAQQKPARTDRRVQKRHPAAH